MKKNAFVCLLCLFLGGCATNKAPVSDPQNDPYEHVNRRMFAFNMAVDKALFRPIAKTYDVVLPGPLKQGISNVYNNLIDVTSITNQLLKLNIHMAISDFARVFINTTVGLGGLFDVASRLGVGKDNGDFGMVLAHWGCKNTPYIVLPFFGPSTIRDAVGLPINAILLNPLTYSNLSFDVQASLYAGYVIERRASLLITDSPIEQAFDPYVFVRDAYLQHRDYLIQEDEKEPNKVHTLQPFKRVY